MKAVKLELYQNFTSYRMESMYKYIQTYPLPTPSMITGMVHTILGLNTYHNLKIGIQGSTGSIFSNMQKIKKVDRSGADRLQTAHFTLVSETGTLTAGKDGIMWVDLIPDVNLILHIVFDDESLTEKLVKKALSETYVLGRNEDSVRVDSCEIVELSEVTGRNTKIENNMYVDRRKDNQIVGLDYTLPFRYTTKIKDLLFESKLDRQDLKENRKFNKVVCAYARKGDSISKSALLSDGEVLVSLIEN